MGYVVLGFILILLGLSGALVLHGTGSPRALVLVGLGLCLFGRYRVHGSGGHRDP